MEFVKEKINLFCYIVQSCIGQPARMTALLQMRTKKEVISTSSSMFCTTVPAQTRNFYVCRYGCFHHAGHFVKVTGLYCFHRKSYEASYLHVGYCVTWPLIEKEAWGLGFKFVELVV